MTTDLPARFNAATYFVDRHLGEGRRDKVAIECGDERVTYRQLAERVDRVGGALRRLGVHPEQGVALILPDTPTFAYSFFGAIKAGMVPVPLNTLWKARDYQHALEDSGARAVVISASLLTQRAIRPARSTGINTTKPGRRSRASGFAPATSTPATPTGSISTAAAPTTC